MRFHVFCTLPYTDFSQPLAAFYDDVFEIVDAAEALGFDGFWLAEHHTTSYSLSSAPLLLLAKAADRTKRIRLGTGVLVLPLWHPVRAASEVATLDLLSHGRLELGVGKGYQPIEFNAFQRTIAENNDAFNECLTLMRRLWTEDEVTHHGRFFTLERPVTLQVRPFQKPHPPIWLATGQLPTVLEAAKMGLRPVVGGGNFNQSQMADMVQGHVKALRASGHNGEARFGSLRQAYVYREGGSIDAFAKHVRVQYRQARHLRMSIDAAKRGIANSDPFPDEQPDDLFLARHLVGTAEQVVQKARALESAGVTDVLLHFEGAGPPVKNVLASMQRFAEEVMPEVRYSR